MIRCFGVVLVAVIFLSGCGTGKKENSSGKTVFRYNEASGITSLDPAYAKGQADIWACNQLYNGLVQMNDALEVIPCIAYRWDISDDGTMYTFHLRDDVFFHKNKAINNGWVPDWSDDDQYKWFPWFGVLSSGSGFSNSGSDCYCTGTTVGSRLCTDSSEKAEYIAEQFEAEYVDYFLYSE